MNPITLPVAELKPALAGLGKVINKRSTLPVLSHVRVARTVVGRLELAVTDLDTALIARLEAAPQGEPTAFLVPYEELQHVAKGCRAGDDLIVAPVESQRIALKFPVAGQIIEHRCGALPVEEFPVIPEITGESTLLDESLRRSIHEALQCASTDTTRLILNGAYLDESKPGAHYVVGTDGRHLFSSNSFTLPLKGPLIIPSHRFLEWKEFHADGDWTLRVAKPGKDEAAQFEIASAHWRFNARSFEGNYPNWRAVLPDTKSVQTTVEFDLDSIEAVGKLVARMPDHDPVNHAIGVEIKDRRLQLLGKSSGEEAWRRLEVEGVKPIGPDVAVHLNRHLLTKALRFGLTKLEIIDGLAPVRFSAGGRQMIVMPVRPNTAPVQPTPPPVSSPAATHPEPPTPNPPPSAEQPNEAPMPDANGTSGAVKRPAGTTPETTDKSALEIALAQIEVVRGDFRNAIAGLNKLSEALKQAQREQKAGDKDIQSVRQTLRSLQSVRI